MASKFPRKYVVVAVLGVIGVTGIVVGCLAWYGAGAGWGGISSPSSSSSISRRLGVLVVALDVEALSSIDGLSVADAWVENIVDRHETFLYRKGVIADRLCIKYESTGAERKERFAIKLIDADEGDLGVFDPDATNESMRIMGTRSVVSTSQLKSHWQGKGKVFDVEVRREWNSPEFEAFSVRLAWPN